MSKHTPGSLKVERWTNKSRRKCTKIVGPEYEVATISYTNGPEEADADRIVACWNACNDLNPEGVPDVVEALKKQQAIITAQTHLLTAYRIGGQPKEKTLDTLKDRDAVEQFAATALAKVGGTL